MNLKHRLARTLHRIAWKLQPAPPNLTVQTSCPMTEATALVISEIASREIGAPVGLGYKRIDGIGTVAHY